MVKLVIIGNSHIKSIRRATRDSGLDRLILSYTSKGHLERRPDGTRAVRPETADLLRRERGPVFSMIGGNAHNVFGLVYPQKPFDFYHPDYPDRRPRPSWIIPYEQVRDSVMRRAATRLDELRAVVAVCPGRVIQLESPPPIPNQGWLTRKLTARMEAAGLAEFEVASASVRYKLWRINSALFQEECARLGVPFIAVPAEACDENGFLLRKYWGDPTHANGDYGQLLLGQMREHLDVAPV